MSAADDAWQAFKLSVPPEVYPTYEDTFMAAYRSGYRRALQDAADAAGRNADHNPTWWPSNPYRNEATEGNVR